MNNGMSQKAVACSFSYSGLSVTCENHGSTLVMRSKDFKEQDLESIVMSL